MSKAYGAHMQIVRLEISCATARLWQLRLVLHASDAKEPLMKLRCRPTLLRDSEGASKLPSTSSSIDTLVVRPQPPCYRV